MLGPTPIKTEFTGCRHFWQMGRPGLGLSPLLVFLDLS